MDIDTFRNYCLDKKAVSESLPFGPDNLVFKVMGKIFAIVSLDKIPLRANLKCDPERAITLREAYDGSIIPGYHTNKQHWNTLILDANLKPELIFDLIDHSYELIINSLSKLARKEFENL